MKKKLVTGILTAALFLGAGTSAFVAYANEGDWNPRAFMQQRGVNVEEAEKVMKQQGINVDQMYEVMNSGDYEKMQEYMQDVNINFGQMLPFMKQMHPNWSTKEIQDHFESMHGTGGSFNSKNFQGMMGGFQN